MFFYFFTKYVKGVVHTGLENCLLVSTPGVKAYDIKMNELKISCRGRGPIAMIGCEMLWVKLSVISSLCTMITIITFKLKEDSEIRVDFRYNTINNCVIIIILIGFMFMKKISICRRYTITIRLEFTKAYRPRM